MAAVAFAWESQSTRSVDCSAAARHAAKLTAVVVFPTPPFWFATAIIRAKPHSRHAQVSKHSFGMQDVSRGARPRAVDIVKNVPRGTPRGVLDLNLLYTVDAAVMFRVGITEDKSCEILSL